MNRGSEERGAFSYPPVDKRSTTSITHLETRSITNLITVAGEREAQYQLIRDTAIHLALEAETILGNDDAFARQRLLCVASVYTGCRVTGGTSGKVVILREELNEKFFHTISFVPRGK